MTQSSAGEAARGNSNRALREKNGRKRLQRGFRLPPILVYVAECAADSQFRLRGRVREVKDPLLGSILLAFSILSS